MVGDEEDIDHLVQNSESTSTYNNFHLSNKEEDNTSYAIEPKLKQSSILLKQKQDNIAITTTKNKEDIEERYEEMNGYVVGNEVDNKVFRNIVLGNEYLTSDKKKITDDVININEDDISTDKGKIRNNNSGAEGDEEYNEENSRKVDEDKVENKAVNSKIVGNDSLLSDDIKVNDDIINFHDGNMSNEKEVCINTNTSSKENLEINKKEIENSAYAYITTQINKNNIVYHAKKDRIIRMAKINKAIRETNYNKKMTSNLNIPSEEHNETVEAKRDEKEK